MINLRGGGVFYPTLRFYLDKSKTVSDKLLKLLDFSSFIIENIFFKIIFFSWIWYGRDRSNSWSVFQIGQRGPKRNYYLSYRSKNH